MPWLVIGALGVGLVWAVSAAMSTPVVRRGPPPPAPRPPGPVPARPLQPARPSITPIRPEAPGVDQGVTDALADAEATHRATTPVETTVAPAPAPRPQDTTVTHLEIEPPRPPPPGTTDSPTRAVPSPAATQASITHSAEPANVVALAREAVDGIRGRDAARASGRVGDTARMASERITAFQNAYGRSLLPADGVYGRRTRHALSLILGVAENTLPPI